MSTKQQHEFRAKDGMTACWDCTLPASHEVHQPPRTVEDMAGECADKVFPHVSDLRSRDALRAALIEFAHAIKREASHVH